MTELTEVNKCSYCGKDREIIIIIRAKTDEFFCSDDCFQASRLGHWSRA